jgi:hypothetical protein
MAINKVIYGDTTLMDISDTTADTSDVMEGKYFYNASGIKVQGSASAGVVDVEVDGTSVVDGNGVAEVDLSGKADASHTHTVSDVTDFPSIPANTSDLNNDSGYITGMYIAAYGKSTYAEVLAAYKANKVVYCRASSSSNPASGNQLRMAFMAYVNNEATPTEFEFQYYRSLSSHTYNDQSDQVFVYKLNKNNGWSVTIRQATTKIIPSTGLAYTFAAGNNPTNTIKVKLNSETSLGTIGVTEGLYPIGVDSNGQLCVLISE